jgi:hypothetical protein
MRTARAQVARRKDDEVEITESEQDQRPWWLRLRAFVGLTVLVAGLGVAAAAVLGLGALALASLVDHALG